MEEYFTEEELEKLKKELDYLKTEKTKEVSDSIRYAAGFGDLKENAAYHEAKEQQDFLMAKIHDLDNVIRNAKIIKENGEKQKNSSGKIQIGSTVKIILGGEKEEIKIVSHAMVDPAQKKISCESPIGKALMGKSVGDRVKVDLGDDKVECEVMEVK